jgi:hypothetical protein
MKKIILSLFALLVVSFAPAARADHDGHIGHRKAEELTTLLYQAVLFRTPAYSEMQGWVQSIESGGYNTLVQDGGAFATSPEFRDDVSPAHSPDQILGNLYGVLLRRAVDPSGYSAWIGYVQSGRTDVVVEGILQSEEFRHLHFD